MSKSPKRRSQKYRRSPSRRSPSRRSPSRRSPSRRSPVSKGSRGLKLVKIMRSPNKDKKYRAVFSRNGKIKNVDFGAAGMSDFTKHKDTERKQRYINRHKSRENFNDPTSRGALSRWVLWNKPSFSESVKDYKRKFKL
jgi:hypothetical protein